MKKRVYILYTIDIWDDIITPEPFMIFYVLCISKDKELRVEIIWLYYNMLTVRHKKRWKTTELVTRNY